MNAYGGWGGAVKVQLHAFQISATDWGEWWQNRRFTGESSPFKVKWLTHQRTPCLSIELSVAYQKFREKNIKKILTRSLRDSPNFRLASELQPERVP